MGLASALAQQAAAGGGAPYALQPAQPAHAAPPPAPAVIAPGYAPPPEAPVSSDAILARLTQLCFENSLHAFYTPQQLQALAQRLAARVDFHQLAERWHLNLDTAVSLSALALYDCIIYADDSDSMESEGGERVEDLKLIVSKVAEVATLFDDDGIEVRFINSNVQGNHIKTAHDASRLVAGLEYRWDTKIGTQLEAKVLAPLVYNRRLAKPLLVVTVTDGEPSDKPADKLISVIQTCVARTTQMGLGPHAVAFQFAQVGKDREAQEFLSRLDRHPQVGGMIDCTSYFELEQSEYAAKGIHLSVEAWLVKLLMGAIDKRLDEADEAAAHPAAGHKK